MSDSTDKKEKNTTEKKPVEVYAERAETKAPELSQDDMKSLALAYAKYLAEKSLKPGDATFVDPEELMKEEAPAKEAATEKPTQDNTEKMRALASEYARLLKESGLKPGEQPASVSSGNAAAGRAEIRPNEATPAGPAEAEKVTAKDAGIKSEEDEERKKKEIMAAFIDIYDRFQDKFDETLGGIGRGFVKGAHDIASTYRHSRKQIGIALLIVGVLAAGILVIFDSFTVYEYAYNGKVLGYVKEQEEVTEVLGIAGEKLSQNNDGISSVEFVANQNVTFNPVDGRGKSTDDMDTAVNKLIYMTDIETEAYAVYDGDRVVAVVKDESSAETLLADALAALSRPDSGMELVSSEFVNELSIQPVNVLLSSVQSNSRALSLMTKGGDMETIHIVEEGETIGSIAEKFGVDTVNVLSYGEQDEDEDEDIEGVSDTGDTTEESEAGSEVMQGDKVCIKSSVEPVMVRMVETGRLKETIEYETIKQDSDEYYQGDTHLEQEGRNGTQIFEGTLTKVSGEIVDRDEISTTVIREKKDKIILIGTKERPKTAPTGTYALPLEYYTVTSEYGWRWGRLHAGIDLAVSSGTPVYASDGGTVIRAGWFGGYGNCVEIDHENGRVTRYGHNSAILVDVGDKVYQGQEIALVGSTGNSTGPHLHFEVILDGTQHNPREFVDF